MSEKKRIHDLAVFTLLRNLSQSEFKKMIVETQQALVKENISISIKELYEKTWWDSYLLQNPDIVQKEAVILKNDASAINGTFVKKFIKDSLGTKKKLREENSKPKATDRVKDLLEIYRYLKVPAAERKGLVVSAIATSVSCRYQQFDCKRVADYLHEVYSENKSLKRLFKDEVAFANEIYHYIHYAIKGHKK